MSQPSGDTEFFDCDFCRQFAAETVEDVPQAVVRLLEHAVKCVDNVCGSAACKQIADLMELARNHPLQPSAFDIEYGNCGGWRANNFRAYCLAHAKNCHYEDCGVPFCPGPKP